ncbi:calreticulin-3 isoform X2 [Eublepharis macularius]|uniref:Calreticulin n=1 Tax=Eublepharis macularius TaxID=481883 RepID=A0AA97JFP1_EUBMA|nr:calreticulin-3 isoform X2 [Eublepharis macularius]
MLPACGLLSLPWALALALPVLGTVYFREQFLDGAKWQERWVLSQHKSNYGKFRLTAGSFYGDRETDKGLQTSENLKFYAISSRFKPFSNKGRPLVIQYTIKHEQKIDCGGGYVKIFPSDLNQKNMSGESQYYIMFGPDICGSDTKKVHVILNYKSKLYPIKKQIRCKRINDPAVKKPENWDDEAEIDDPDDTKPEDWNVAEYIVDNSAEKPKEWDDMKQGVWQPPLLKNPLYRGEWQPRKIPNPNYKGIWPHPQIENPAYVPDLSISVYENISVIGLDLWQVRSGSIFDNFLITDDETYAEEFGDETWRETQYPEQKMHQEQIEEEKKRERAREEDHLKGQIKERPKKKAPRKNKSKMTAAKEEL